MHRVLPVVLVALVSAAVAGCAAGAPTPTSTVVTVVKTEQSVPARASQSQPAVRDVTLPDVVGQRLDVAELHLDHLRLRYREVGGGAFGVVVRSNWTVCQQEPSGGARNPGRVSLIVARECG